MYVDSHCHLSFPELAGQIDQVLERMRTAQVGAALASQTALGRVGQPDDIGPVMAALLQPGMGWVQGQRIEASGGMFL